MRTPTPLVLSTAVLVAAVVAPRPVFAQCPSNLVAAGCGTAVGYVVSTPSYGYDEILWSTGQACLRACYDLKQGHLVVKTTGSSCWSMLQLTDTFRLEGPSPGTPYAFYAELQLTSTTPQQAVIAARIGDPATDTEDAINLVASEPGASRTLTIPLLRSVGESFDLDLDLNLVSGSGTTETASVEGRVYFRGLPAGVGVTSCQAYGVAVPVRAISWGGLKSTYR